MNFISDNLGKIVFAIIVAGIAFNISLYFFASCDSVGWLPTREIFEPIQGRLALFGMLETPESQKRLTRMGYPRHSITFRRNLYSLPQGFPLHSDSVGLEST